MYVVLHVIHLTVVEFMLLRWWFIVGVLVKLVVGSSKQEYAGISKTYTTLMVNLR